MNEIEVQRLLEMLLQATHENKLTWEKEYVNGIEGFKTAVDGCKILIFTSYNPMDECWEGHLDLYNSNSILFFSNTYSSNVHTYIYDTIYSLTLVINDILLQITQSKNKILGGLERILYGM